MKNSNIKEKDKKEKKNKKNKIAKIIKEKRQEHKNKKRNHDDFFYSKEKNELICLEEEPKLLQVQLKIFKVFNRKFEGNIPYKFEKLIDSIKIKEKQQNQKSLNLLDHESNTLIENNQLVEKKSKKKSEMEKIQDEIKENVIKETNIEILSMDDCNEI